MCHVQATTHAGYTALHLAAMGGHDATVRALSKAGVHINAASTNGGMTALHYAAKFGHKGGIVALKDCGADIEV